MHSTKYKKAPFCLSELASRELALYHVGPALFKFIFSDYSKSLNCRINEVYVFFKKISLYRYLIFQKISL